MNQLRSASTGIVFAFAGVLAGCGSSGTGGAGSASPSAGAAPPVERFVAFDTRTPLCREPRLDDSVCATVPSDGAAWGYDAIAKVLEDRGAWLRIETTDRWQILDHCGNASSDALGQQGLRVAFYIQRSALVPVTTAQEIAFGNGTKVALRSGIPVMPGDGDVSPDLAQVGSGFPLLLTRKSVLTSETYEASAPFLEAAQPSQVAEGRAMRYGVPLPTLDFPTRAPNESRASGIAEAPGVLRDPGEDTFVYSQARHDAGVLVELRSPCTILHAVVASDAVVPSRPRFGARNSLAMALTAYRERRTSRYRVRAGAALRYLDGSPAGRAGELDVPFQGNERPQADRVCMDRELRGWRGPRKPTPTQIERSRITLCASTQDVMPWPRFLSDAEAATLYADTKTVLVVEVDNRSERDAATVTAELRAALRDAFLVGPGFAFAPASLGFEAARAFAASHGAAAVRIRVVVHPVEIERRDAWFNVRRNVEGDATLADGSIVKLPLFGGGGSPGADDVVGGKLTQSYLDESFAQSMEQAASTIRARIVAGEKPPKLDGLASLRDVPIWAMPPGFGPAR